MQAPLQKQGSNIDTINVSLFKIEILRYITYYFLELKVNVKNRKRNFWNYVQSPFKIALFLNEIFTFKLKTLVL